LFTLRWPLFPNDFLTRHETMHLRVDGPRQPTPMERENIERAAREILNTFHTAQRDNLMSGTLEGVGHLLTSQFGVDHSYLMTGQAEAIGTGWGFGTNNPQVRREVARILQGPHNQAQSENDTFSSHKMDRQALLMNIIRSFSNPLGLLIARVLASWNRWMTRRGSGTPLAILALAAGLGSWWPLFGPVATKSLTSVNNVRLMVVDRISPRQQELISLRAA